MPHDQLMPRRARRAGMGRLGLGAVTPPPQLPQLSSLTSSNPAFQNSWNQIQSQLVSEGASTSQFQAAQLALVNSWTQLTGTQFGVNADQALTAATQYAMTAQTALGAAKIVTGLVSAMGSGKPPSPALVQSFTGTLIGTLVTVGALSSGVGAVIIAAVGLALTVLQDVANALFSKPPTGTTVAGLSPTGASGEWTANECAGVVVNPVPACAIGCMAAWGPDGTAGTWSSISPSSSAWRNFPDPTSSSDAWWYQTANGGPSTSWDGAQWATTWGTPRQIDFAFPYYRWLECDVANAPSSVLPFVQAFFSAWKANASYALNGLQPAPDATVLAQVILLWNRANPNGTPYTLAPTVSSNGTGQYEYGNTCPSAPAVSDLYMSQLVQYLVDNPVAGVSTSAAGVVINGPASTPIVPTDMNPGLFQKVLQFNGSAQGSSTLANVAAGTIAAVGVAAGGLAVYAYTQRTSFTGLLRSLWSGAKGLV
jgi:hypothetical protein